ncbi:LIC_13387 family protein [Chryseolinea soli]|nr:hypothetical protein [Chryseolinea soli]
MAYKIKPTHLVRVAALLMAFHALGHTMGALNWKKNPNENVNLVITSMQTEHFDFMGRSATLGQFYEGYGIIMILVLALISLQLWMLSDETGNPKAVKILTSMAVFLILMAGFEYIYFFPLAATISFLAGICVILSLIGKKTTKPA